MLNFCWTKMATISFSLLLLLVLHVADTAAQQVLSIHGSGTTLASKCYWHVMDKMETRAKQPLHMTYRAIGSSSGQAEFSQNEDGPIVDFASGDIPLTRDRYDALQEHTTVLQLPLFLGAVSFYYSQPSTAAGTSVPLNMTACTLAKVFTGSISSWDHEEIVQQNPELSFDSMNGNDLKIRVARRVDGSSSTSVMTQVFIIDKHLFVFLFCLHFSLIYLFVVLP
jgi:ABC-type phosphate transport system substrate-binding protein